jgi:hypothetical protein
MSLIYINPYTFAAAGIVTDGLVLNLDAGNPASYPGSGTTWTDLSGQGSIGTLKGGVGYNSAHEGFLTFDGSNDFVSIPNNTALNTQTPTVEVWIKTNNTNQNGFFFEKGSVNTQYSLFQEGAVIRWRQKDSNGGLGSIGATTADFISTSNWAQVIGTYTSGSRKFYINGTLRDSDTLAVTLATNNDGMSIGAWGGTTDARGYYYNGNLAICRVYNRALSAAEITQNFDALKGRYGL